MPDVVKERVSPPTYSDFHVHNKFIPEDTKYSPLVCQLASSCAVSAFNSVHVSEANSSYNRTHEVVDAKLGSVTQPTLPPDTIQLGHNG